MKAQILKHTLHTLPRFHHSHVQAAKQNFDNENVQQTQEDPAFNKQENKALKFLKACLTTPDLSSSERNTLQGAINQIHQGTVKSLVKELNLLAKSIAKSKQNSAIEDILALLAKYEKIYLEEQNSGGTDDAQIVISQSYTE